MVNSSTVLSVIVPAFNEAERIGKTLRSIGEYLRSTNDTHEVIVVDDGSKDDTKRVVRSYAGLVDNLKLLELGENRGKGWAVRTGMLRASGRFRLFMDADGSTSIDHWERVRSAFDNGADIVVGSRHVEGSDIRVKQAPHREILGGIFRNTVKHMFGMPVQDTQNGFKAFRAAVAERIFRLQRVSGWAFDVEILSSAHQLNYSIAEIPIMWIDDERSRMTFSAMPKMLYDLFRIRIGAIPPSASYRLRETPQLMQLS